MLFDKNVRRKISPKAPTAILSLGQSLVYKYILKMYIESADNNILYPSTIQKGYHRVN